MNNLIFLISENASWKDEKKKLVEPSDIFNIGKNSDLNTKLATLARKVELKAEQYKTVKRQTFDSRYIPSKNYFEDDGTQSYLVFQLVSGYFKTVANTSKVTAWKSKGLSDKGIKPPSTSDNSLNPGINYFDNFWIRLKFQRNCLEQEKVTFTHMLIVNIYIVHGINVWSFTAVQDFTLENCLFRADKFNTNADSDKYKFSGYGIGFDESGIFLLSVGSGFDQNVIIFWADMSSSVHTDNKKKDILIKVQRIG